MAKPGIDPSGGQRLLFTTADAGLEAWGKSRKALYRQALRAFTRILALRGPSKVERFLPFDMEAPTSEGLLVKILNESLYLWETRQGLSCLVPPRGALPGMKSRRSPTMD